MNRAEVASGASDTLPQVLPRDSEILDQLREKGSRILSFDELARKLQVSEPDEEAFRDLLDSLERRGVIARVRGEKYSAIEFTNQVAGRITVRPEGFGFVLVDGGPDLYIPRAGMQGAMDGDTVLAREGDREMERWLERMPEHMRANRGRGPSAEERGQEIV